MVQLVGDLWGRGLVRFLAERKLMIEVEPDTGDDLSDEIDALTDQALDLLDGLHDARDSPG